MEKPARIRFEDRTRWAPMAWMYDVESRPAPYFALGDPQKAVARQVTAIIYRMLTHKDPL